MLVAPGTLVVVAPNPGMMTGKGTNSYLLGNGEVAVVDPGPLIPEHVDRLVEASQELGRLTTALVTHWHPDHMPAALELKRRLGVKVAGHPSLPMVDWPLNDAERLAVGGVEVRAVHTPGHTRDHVCYVVEEHGLLFSGDHVAGEGTVVISPPDGDMAAYLDSLRTVFELHVHSILPGHGPLVARPRERVRDYLDHRLQRERQVMALLCASPRTIDELVASIYRDVPEQMHPVASRTVLAHLLKLRDEGAARRDHLEERWTVA